MANSPGLDVLERWARAIVATVVSLLSIIWIYNHLDSQVANWPQLLRVAMTVGLGVIVVMVIRSTLHPLIGPIDTVPMQPDSASSSPDAVRKWLAPMIIGIGTAGILLLAGLIIFILSCLGQEPQIKQQAITGIFTAVLPVLATWVGTVLAFYFTNESFRQAAASTRELAEATSGPQQELLRTSPRVVRFDKITGNTLSAATTTIADARTAANALPLQPISDIFKGSQTVTRYMIFDSQRRPIYVLRQAKLDPQVLATNPNATVKDYLALAGNQDDALNFRTIAINCTVADARNLLARTNARDIFITQNGREDEAAFGWTSDDLLQA